MRIIRRLGAAVVAVIALTAWVGATAASASPAGFIADSYASGGAVLHGIGSGQATMKLNGLPIKCTTAPFEEHHTGPSSTLAAQPGGTCEWTFADGTRQEGQLIPNGCKFLAEPGAEGPSFSGTFSVGPSNCGPMEIETPKNCLVKINPHSGFSAKSSYENLGSGTGAYFNMSLSATGLEYSRSGTGCPSPGTFKSGEYSVSWKVMAKSTFGTARGVKVISELPFGFYLAGKGSEKESEQPRFEAETYPRAISGGGLSTFVVGADTMSCGNTGLTGSVAAASKQLSLAATYAGCTIVGKEFLTTTVDMKSCKYTVTVQNVGPPYSGQLGVTCTGEDKIEFKTFSGATLVCTTLVGPQSGLSGISLSNTGAGVDRVVSYSATVGGVAYEKKGLCGKSSGTGTMSGSSTLVGVG